MTAMTLPSQARIVIVGGGIAGCSTAYHLGALGEQDVLVLEQGKLTCGTTWHAAGLVGQMRPNRTMTRMSRYGIELYAALEAETGLATGWKQCGSVNVAQTRERMMVLRKQLALARSFGVECEEITPERAGELFPVLRTDDLAGAIWIPGDGKANPADLTMSLAKGARTRGVRIVEDAEVVAVRTEASASGSAVAGVRVRHGGEEREVACEVVVNCAGQWARQLGALAGVNVPLWSAEHFYIVTDRIEGVHPMLPVLRDPDGYIYYKEEVGGLLMGGFEPKAKPWRVDPIPSTFQFQLLDEDWEQFEPLMTAAIRRTPCLETAKVKMLLNGPESFTPDGNFILGEAPGLGKFFVAAGFNSAGIANSGGAGKLIAEWIVTGAPQSDLADVDIRRFGDFWANKRALAERTGETLGLHYAMRWPRQELETARPLKTSPLHDLLAARGAAFGSKNGWERANYFRAADATAAPYPHTLGKPGWLADVVREQRATRRAVALFDQSSFGKILVQGSDALALLQRLCANEMDVAPGRMVYTPMLNARGGFESDVTVTRLGIDRFLVVTGSAQTPRDLDWIERHRRAGEAAVLTDVSALTSVLSLMGPNAQHAARARRRARDLRRARPRAAQVRDDARDRPRPRARPRGAHELRRRAGLRALRSGRDGAPRVSRAARSERRPGPGRARPRRRRLLRARRTADRGRPARLGRRARSRRDAARGGNDVRRQAREARRVHRQAGAPARGSGAAAQEARDGRHGRCRAVAVGRRDAPGRGRPCRRGGLGGLERPGRSLHRSGLSARRSRRACARRNAAHRRPLG